MKGTESYKSSQATSIPVRAPTGRLARELERQRGKTPVLRYGRDVGESGIKEAGLVGQLGKRGGRRKQKRKNIRNM